jgi:uncharacterized membrane-anchored protein
MSMHLGYAMARLQRRALAFAAGLALFAAGYFYTSVLRTLLLWTAFILTRPLE